jgi:hypothetical protein
MGDAAMAGHARRITTSQQGNILARLGIDVGEPWVWISSGGPIVASRTAPLLHVDGPEGFPTSCPFPYTTYSTDWDGFTVFLVGLPRPAWWWDYALGPTGYHFQWTDSGRTFDVELCYQRIQHCGSKLYAYVLSGRPGNDAGIQNALLSHKMPERALAWQGLDLILRGPQPGRPAGTVKGGEPERWVRRCLEIGEPAALGEFKAETLPGRGAWTPRYQWWYRHVRPRLQKSP